MTISAKIIPISALKDNYIWLFFNEISRDAWIVDPGDAEPAILALKKYKLNLSGIFITHHHYDHSGGVNDLLKHWKKLEIYGSHKSSLKFITQAIKENDEIICSNIKFKVIEIPGHTLDHTAYFANGILFCGDTLFSVGCGKIFEGTPSQMYHSLCKLAELPDNTNIYCGHEYTLSNLYFAQHVDPENILIANKIQAVKKLLAQNKATLPAILSEEKLINPFLRCDQTEIIHAVELYTNKRLYDPIEVFTNLREWKNHFKAM